MAKRIHILGASGSGTTTLGKAAASAANIPFLDSDDFYFDLKYSRKRAVERRNSDLEVAAAKSESWVLSGSIDGWNSNVVTLFSHLVFLYLEVETRLTRLHQRELNRYGAEAIVSGGAEHAHSLEFLEWAKHYEDGTREGRSLARHESWMKTLKVPILRLNSTQSVGVLVDKVLSFAGV